MALDSRLRGNDGGLAGQPWAETEHTGAPTRRYFRFQVTTDETA